MKTSQPISAADPSLDEGDASLGRAEILRPAQIFDPVARALDVIGDRWSLVLVRQLLGGAKGFQELRQRTGIAARVLSSRLRQLRADEFVETEPHGGRSIYRVTNKGRSLEPIISSIARWWVREGISALDVDATRFTETSALSVLESLPNLLRDEVAQAATVVFEIRLSGEGGGVWTVEISNGRCEIRNEFAEGADVRYTASARDWCAVALGVLDAKEAVKRGLLHKEGGPQAIDEFFYQIARPSKKSSTQQGGKTP
ncbi:MAG: winged helix-turn-helix transcriptional regulator [Myxococcota bacterium]